MFNVSPDIVCRAASLCAASACACAEVLVPGVPAFPFERGELRYVPTGELLRAAIGETAPERQPTGLTLRTVRGLTVPLVRPVVGKPMVVWRRVDSGLMERRGRAERLEGRGEANVLPLAKELRDGDGALPFVIMPLPFGVLLPLT